MSGSGACPSGNCGVVATKPQLATIDHHRDIARFAGSCAIGATRSTSFHSSLKLTALLDKFGLDWTLLEPIAEPLRAPGEFAACLNQLGIYTTEHFVLRLSPRVHELLDAISSGVDASGELDGETVQAYSTYLHETIHWWQHIGSTSGLILSLTYPAQAHQNVEHLEKVLGLVGPKKSLKRWAEDAARAGLTDEDPSLRWAKTAMRQTV
ncbi:hypothetical protein [Bradyrhizobium sp. RT11b]|uniref:hypothetical protein n=1 Tax=Bradyrhizobium sp. RT11b TaxID=3156332 RepID=UPI00339431DA